MTLPAPRPCPYCRAAVADLAAHDSTAPERGGCVHTAFALSAWTPYREPSTRDVRRYKPRQARHLRLGKA